MRAGYTFLLPLMLGNGVVKSIIFVGHIVFNSFLKNIVSMILTKSHFEVSSRGREVDEFESWV